MSERNIEKNPYSADETRVAKWFCDKGIGGGDDPIGALLALHEFGMAELKSLQKQLADAKTDGEMSAGAVMAMRRWAKEGLDINATFVDDEMMLLVGLSQRAILAGLAADAKPTTLARMRVKAEENRAGHEKSLGFAITSAGPH